ncbi:MAG: TIGR00269 family protein [Methanobacteriota archaeon]|nr:MAG: TIGR00269 family protein [Euryarchaeota archaeon]
MTSCDKCSRPSVILIRYSGARLCKTHLCEFVVKRAKHELRRQVKLGRGQRLAVAVSGGKDSTVAAFLLKEILGPRRDISFCAITVDEGIRGYRESSIPIAADNCRELDMEHIVVSFENVYGLTMDEIAKAERNMSACAYCGVMRRAVLNRTARELEASVLATGLNLDDTSQSILMNFSRGDIQRLARMGPHRRRQHGLVPRIQPLRTVPENEVALFALSRGIRYHDLECPYAMEALRNEYRRVLAELEDRYPGTRHSILRSHNMMMDAVQRAYPQAELRSCECGEPTVSPSGKCKVCELVASLRQDP